MLYSKCSSEVSVEVVAEYEKWKTDHVGEANFLEKSNTAVNEPNWCCNEMIDLPAEADHSMGSSSDSMNLSWLIIFASSCCKFELLLNSHSCDYFLSHTSCCQIIVPSVLIQLHHDNVEYHEENNQIDGLTEIVIFLVLHEANDSVDDHWIAHVDETMGHDSNACQEIPILESNHDGYKNIFGFLCIEDFFDFGELSLNQVVVS